MTALRAVLAITALAILGWLIAADHDEAAGLFPLACIGLGIGLSWVESYRARRGDSGSSGK